MSVRPPIHGSTYYDQPNRNDVYNKLTYQMLLADNKNLRAEIDSLRDLNSRMGRELYKLHNQFQIKDHLQENLNANERGLYSAMQNEPALFKYLPFLIPLLESYDYKIKKFYEAFENSSSYFINIERKYDEILYENSRLKQKIEDRTKQLIEFYRNKSPSNVNVLFKDILEEQTATKHYLLTKYNSMLLNKVRYFESKSRQLAEELKTRNEKQQQESKQLRDIERYYKAQTAELNNLRKNYNYLKIQNNTLESGQTQIQKSYDRSMVQIKALNDYISKLYSLLKQLRDETETKVPYSKRNTDSKKMYALEKELSYLRAELKSNDNPKVVESLRQYVDYLNRQLSSNRYIVENASAREKLLGSKLNESKDKILKLESEIGILKTKYSQLAKSLNSITERSKNEAEDLTRSFEDKIRGIEYDLQGQIDQKEYKIRSLTEQLERLKAYKDRADKYNRLLSMDEDRSSKGRDLSRQVYKLNEKIKNTYDIHRETMELVYSYNYHLKSELREMQNIKSQLDTKIEELRRLRLDFDKIRSYNYHLLKYKAGIIEYMKKIRSTYEVALKYKENIFDAKVRYIRVLLEDSVAKYKSSREEIGEIARSYKKKVEDIKNIYEERVRELQTQVDTLKRRYLENQTTTTQHHTVTVMKKAA